MGRDDQKVQGLFDAGGRGEQRDMERGSVREFEAAVSLYDFLASFAGQHIAQYSDRGTYHGEMY